MSAPHGNGDGPPALAGPRHDSAHERGDGDTLGAVRETALQVLGALPHPPSALRIQVGAVTLELDWPVNAAPQGAPPGPASPAAPAAGAADHIGAVSVGVFYRAPEPGAEPFVREGSVVAAGQQVAIVEAMKLMIPVTATRACRIVRALVEDGSAVEFDQPLFEIAAAGA
ncbi:hypothetical protein MF672_045950 [Actinomadura sp. ATCC 31491]|uniref:Biotin carboxyl carrier protein of acetyl-CoA carboxylase n=1 Tax=Actinomadura luzonensis TaxID=2805427 RepID=A0ABT0GAI8_9ACTN|nr:biotin/lipoyl-containing protein [Actinomadura luzonensis]MCK2221098.1 hypothetical protein [Actinomadura luzonensis]